MMMYVFSVHMEEHSLIGRGGHLTFHPRYELTKRKKWSVMKCCNLLLAMSVLFGGIEVALIFALKVHFNPTLCLQSMSLHNY